MIKINVQIYSNNMYASANIIPFSFGEIVYESELQIVTETSPSYIPVIYSPSESLQMVRKGRFQNIFREKRFSFKYFETNERLQALTILERK